MKKFNKKYILLLIFALFLFSCAELDDSAESGIEIEKPANVTANEKINSYDVLSSYSGNLVLGATVSSGKISGSGFMGTLLHTNFKQLTPTTALNSSVILSNEGTYDFSSIKTYLGRAENLGLSVYGDAIISNTNQNSTYLNTVGAPLTFLTPLFPNFVNSAPIEEGTFTGWNVKGNVSIENYMGKSSVKMVNGPSVNSSDATSLQSPVYNVDENSMLELTFYLLSTQVSKGRVIFSGLNNNEPAMDWMGTGIKSPSFTTKIGWNAITVKITDFDGSGQFSFKIELGYTPDVTYYMNIEGLSLVNLNGSVDNPDEIFLECEDAQQIGQWMVTETGDATSISGGKTLVGIINGDIEADNTGGGNPSDANNQDLQFTYTFNVKTSGTYRVWIRQKAYKATGDFDSYFMSVDGANYYCPGWPGWGDLSNTTNWTWMKLYTNSKDKEGSSLFYLSAGEHTISFRIREGGHYFDRLYLTMTTNEPSGLGSAAIAQKEITLETSKDVKKTAVQTVLNDYVTNVLTNLNDKINAWTVVKNPFANDGSVAVSATPNNGTYYWADYIGDDYIAQAFEVAKANASDGTELFLAETDLNTNSSKLDAVINSTKTITEINGLAVRLNLSFNSDMNDIESMFDKLAATGKLIYVTNFSVSISEETSEQDSLQSDVYQKVVELYKSHIPEDQQYGISLSSPVSNEVGLWDENYNRKYPYMGFVVGLGAAE